VAKSTTAVLRQAIRSAEALVEQPDVSDRDLLRRFAEHNDQAAFAALVRRHGGMVLGVCRRTLGNVQDAEDACQATFLVLLKKAAASRWQPSVASWLYTTARRVAANARLAAQRRARREGRAAVPEAVEPADLMSGRELLAALDEELAKLPPRYREPLVLCYLEGLTRDEVATRLGVPAATVKTQLERGRKKLGDALVKRGCVLGAGLLALAVTSPAGASSPRLVEAILATVSGTPPAAVAALARESSMTTLVSKSIPVIIAVAATALFGVGLAALDLPAANRAAVRAAAKGAADADRANQSKPAPTASDTTVSGRVLGPAGKPAAGVELLLVGRSPAAQRLGVTGPNGRFTVAVPRGESGVVLVARLAGTGVDFIDLGQVKQPGPIEMRLVKDQTIRGRVIDTQGKPVRGLRVSLKHISIYADNSLDSFLDSFKKQPVFSPLPRGVKSVWDEGVLPAATTDRDGRFTVAGAGIERLVQLHFRGAGVADAEVWVVNQSGFDPRPHNKRTGDNMLVLGGPKPLLSGPDLSVVAEPDKPIRGVVKDRDTGRPRQGTRVTLWLNGNVPVPIRVSATTDSRGRYEIRGARKSDRGYLVEVASDPTSGHMHCQARAADTPGYGPVTLDIGVKKGVILTGRVVDRATGKPLPGIVEAKVLVGNPFAKDYPEFTGGFDGGYALTARDGTFRIVTVPGPVILMGGPSVRYLPDGLLGLCRYKPAMPDPEHPKYFSRAKAHDGIHQFHHFFGLDGRLSPLQWQFARVLHLKAGEDVVKQDVVLERASALPVKIVDSAGHPVRGTWVKGISSQEWFQPVRLDRDTCAAYHLQPGQPRLLVVHDPAGKRFGTLRLKGDEKEPALVKLGPGGTVKGRLVGEDGKPLPGVAVQLWHRQRTARDIHEQVHRSRPVKTGAEGTFQIDEVIPGVPFTLSLNRGGQSFAPAELVDQTAAPGKTLDLGDLKVRPK
jgi:RNA polymerase sigma factor (sigma-70 family)